MSRNGAERRRRGGAPSRRLMRQGDFGERYIDMNAVQIEKSERGIYLFMGAFVGDEMLRVELYRKDNTTRVEIGEEWNKIVSIVEAELLDGVRRYGILIPTFHVENEEGVVSPQSPQVVWLTDEESEIVRGWGVVGSDLGEVEA